MTGLDGLMANPSKSHTQAAIQLLVWAIEEIERAGNPLAAEHARSALRDMQRAVGDVDPAPTFN
jgi:hypothetical protein